MAAEFPSLAHVVIFQIFVVTLFLYVIGLENWATMSPHSELNYGDDDYKPPQSRTFRFAVAGLVYLSIGECQNIKYKKF